MLKVVEIHFFRSVLKCKYGNICHQKSTKKYNLMKWPWIYFVIDNFIKIFRMATQFVKNYQSGNFQTFKTLITWLKKCFVMRWNLIHSPFGDHSSHSGDIQVYYQIKDKSHSLVCLDSLWFLTEALEAERKSQNSQL